MTEIIEQIRWEEDGGAVATECPPIDPAVAEAFWRARVTQHQRAKLQHLLSKFETRGRWMTRVEIYALLRLLIADRKERIKHP